MINRNKRVEKMVGKFVIWATDNGYMLTDRKQRFTLCKGSLEECEKVIDLHPYGMTLAEMEAYTRG